MRLWTLHPRYLDPQGLVAAWREALLAQKVLQGGTRGYRNHPQLERFRAAADPLAAIATFLHELVAEAERRGYKFDAGKIVGPRTARQIKETRGQLDYEWSHLRRKLGTRAPELAKGLRRVAKPEPHPLFRIVAGKVRAWEKQPVRRPARGRQTRRGSEGEP
ncbi:MAG: pyrimidine dimer DNA glycosylase/endonuclease V [Verrucomicrobiota bacterium]